MPISYLVRFLNRNCQRVVETRSELRARLLNVYLQASAIGKRTNTSTGSTKTINVNKNGPIIIIEDDADDQDLLTEVFEN